MPLTHDHLINFLNNSIETKDNSELLNLLIKRINKLCYEECEIDRILCTLTPMCTRRLLLKLRIKNGLEHKDLPEFCYSVNKSGVYRHFWGKTVVYKPFDVYLYIIDFLDIFFHGDYRKLNKSISFKKWEDAIIIFDQRIQKGENFQYFLTQSKEYFIFKFDEKIHVLFINKNFAICNANREKIESNEILYGLCELSRRIFFPEYKVKFKNSEHVEIIATIPIGVCKRISTKLILEDNNSEPEENESKSEVEMSKLDNYFNNIFPKDLETLSDICDKISLIIDDYSSNLVIKLYLNTESNHVINRKNHFFLRYRDLRLLFNFVFTMYNNYYIYWLE